MCATKGTGMHGNVAWCDMARDGLDCCLNLYTHNVQVHMLHALGIDNGLCLCCQ